MTVKLSQPVYAAMLAVVLTSCATTNSSDDFNFDYSSAEMSDFNGYWEGRVNCNYANGFKPVAWVRISDGRGEFGFGKGAAGHGHTLGSIHSDFDSKNGKISWRGRVIPWSKGKKTPVSFKGQWQEKQFKLSGKIDAKYCSGVIRRFFN